MNWITWFDISRTSYWADWNFVVLGILFVPVLIFHSLRKSSVLKLLRMKGIVLDEKALHFNLIIWRFMGGCVAIIVVAVGFLSFYSHVLAYNTLRKTYEHGKCEQVCGVVTNFIPMPYDGHSNESFAVDDKKFCYSDYDLTNPGFHKTNSHGGPISNGVRVHIWFNGNSVARLDVAEENKP